ncbi:CHAT domain-containing protein [Nostoc sp. FACHB-152]|uniref:CHAT domain-containing protein n=1 Tax=unclassified Nostoc TaxID=2593658 RepID=UPI001688CA93|nr:MULTISPECIES: CHAT domain-containing tetratricopeptide repeat protein [unclassified Nostoc]MBD2447553.1 CHAT domain-containing protein [Nostoc sp. FACHB-152]MBD2469323.1 CHAT domain-containing protein [Nostoc sp. FACHB-145]
MSKWKISKSLQRQSLLFAFSRSIFLLSSIILFSHSSLAITEQHPVNIAQLKQTKPADTTSTAADEAYQKAKQLYQQGTGESLQQAIGFFEKALLLYREAGDRTSQAFTVAHLGKIYSDLGQQRKALDYLNQALVLRREIGDKKGETITLNNIGNVYTDIGELPKALEYFQQALLLKRQMGDKAGEAISINNIGNVYLELGEPQKALDNFEQSLIIRREVKDKLGEVRTLNNIGVVYLELGEQQKALEYFQQCLPLYKQTEDKSAQSHTLNNIASIYLNSGDKQQSLDYFQKSLALRQLLGDKLGEARTLNNIGRVYLALGDKQQALDYLQKSLPLFKSVENKLGLAANLNNIGYVYLDAKEQQKALDYFQQSLPLYQQVGNRGGEAQALYTIATAQRNLGNLQAALNNIKIVINIIEDQRTKINSQELRTSYFATVQNYYQFYIDLLMQLHKQQPAKGYDALALQTSERARARSLLELLSEANADIRQGVEPKLLSQEKNLQQQLDTLEKRRIQILSGEPTTAQVEALETESQTLLEQYQQLQAKIRATSPRYAALTQPQPLSLTQIQQQVLDDDTLLLEYSLGKNCSYLWLVTNKNITSYELPKRADIEAVVQDFRQAITSPHIRNNSSINSLSKLVLAPVAKQLKNKRLLIVSDGALQYVPFAALTQPNLQKSSYKPLLLNHEIITLPSASTVAILRREQKQRKSAAKTLVVLADPIFSSDDERIQGKSQVVANNNLESLALTRSARDADISFDRLNFTRQEAEQILALVPANKAKEAVDFTASRSTATSNELSQYSIVHFATHGIINSKHPELSGIVLSLFDQSGKPQNGFLRLHDIFNLKLQAELVVLSACQTGLGEEVQGEGLVGLTRGFMYAGSPRVVVSLWSVDDQATSELMKLFYEKMLKAKLKPAAALRAAQIEIWRSQKYTAPYYWAAFTLQGEWK